VSRLHEYNYHAPRPHPRPGRRPARWPWLVLAAVLALVAGGGAYLVRAGALDLDAVRRDLGFAPPGATAPPRGGATAATTPSAAGEDGDAQPPANPNAASAAETPAAEPAPPTAPPATPTPPPLPPEEVAAAYVERWNAGDYAGLYELLTAEAKASISRRRFVDRYEGVVDRAGLTKVTARVEGEPNLQREVPLRVDYVSSLVGEFSELNRLPLARDGAGWGVAWTPTLLFKDLGADGCVEVESEQPPRGAILDRDRQPLAYDGTVHRVGVVPGEIDPAEEDRVLRELSELTGISEEDIERRYEDADPSWFVPIKDFPEARGDELLTAVSQLPGVAVQPATGRVYPLGPVAAHVTGYVSEATAEQVEEDPSLTAGQLIGQAGIEAGADDLLTGEPGGRLFVVQCETRAERTTIAERPPVPAQDVVLTIDRGLQEAVDAALSAQAGADRASAVVLDPRTGAVLAMVSHPAYDPNGFTLGFSERERQALDDPELRPLTNRAAQQAYPTGSIFKVITFAAAMEDLGLTAESVVDCPSTFSLQGANQVWEDWTVAEGLPPQGPLTLHRALVNSCNTVFYQLGRDLDQTDQQLLPDMAKAFGLGAPTDIPYLPEIAGTVPDPQWKLDTFGDYWATGDAVNLAIGQGFLTATPLQMATAYAAIANGGDLLEPYLVAETIGPDGTEEVGGRKVRAELPLSDTTIQALQAALRDQTSDPTGAGSVRVFGDFPWPIAGKTGTAQNQQGLAGGEAPASPGDTPDGDANRRTRPEDRQAKPHSWFAAFGPSGEEATIASVVMVENAGEGVSFAAPITRRIYEAYLRSDLAAG